MGVNNYKTVTKRERIYLDPPIPDLGPDCLLSQITQILQVLQLSNISEQLPGQSGRGTEEPEHHSSVVTVKV